jgi:predicted nucleic acid-binding protein
LANSTGRVFIDTNVPMYAGGAPHAFREPAKRVIRAVASGALDAVTDAEVFQEILYRYRHIGESHKGFQIFDHFFGIMEGRILPIEDADVRAARGLADRYPALSPRDLIHLGVMTRGEIAEIITADEGFEGVAEVRRVELASFLPTTGWSSD